MRSSPVFVEKNGLQYKKIRNCNCCPYGYHIDLDFVRYCESLANAKPSEEQLRRRSRRRSRKSMEFMLGLESLFEHWEPAGQVQPVQEVVTENEAEYPKLETINKFTSQHDPELHDACNGDSWTLSFSNSSTVPTDANYSSDIQFSTVAINSPPEDRSAFLHDALDEVVSDFERTLERTSIKRKQKRNCNSWDEFFDATDSCVAGNKSRSTKQKHSDPEVVRSKVPPPPPPRRIKDHDSEASTKNVLPADTISEAYTLYSIRQQMAISLNRMKDLEEQVKSIPKLQNELTQLRDEKHRLQEELQKKEDDLLKSKEQSISQAAAQIISNQSPRLSSPITFTPQRVSPVALESLTVKLRSGSLSSNENPHSSPHVLKRDVAVMCTSHTREVGVGNSPILTRSIGTSSNPAGDIFEKLYTKQEVNEFAQIHIEEYETQKRVYQKKNVVSVGTQMFSTAKKDSKNSAIQTLPEPIVQKFSIGIMARPSLRDVMVSCEPKTRSVATSDHRINDNICDKCNVSKRNIGCGPELEEEKRKSVSLKLMDMPGRSLTFSLGDNEKLNIKRKTIGTQSQWLTHSIGMQTSVPNSSVGIQNVPQFKSECTQCLVESASRQTDTNGLIEVRAFQVNTDRIPEIPKPICTDSSCNTDLIKTVDNAVNTLPSVTTKHSSCNTEQLHKRDIGCGDIVKPHISIACADNYCDSCKEAIRHLAKDFCKVLPSSPSSISSRESSRIPRPTHLTSPSPVRKKFMRQNTYTITPSPTPSPVAEKKSMTSSLNEKSIHTTSLDSDNLTSVSISSLPRNESNEMRQKQLLGKISSVDDSKIRDLCHGGSIGDIGENLIVKEETRVRISWSRENSPAPSTSTSSTVKTVVENNALSKLEKEADDIAPAKDVQEKTEIQPVSSQRSQREVQAMIMNQIVSQETVPRKKIYPSKEMQAALKVINDSLQKCSSKSSDYKSATAVVQIEWFHISSTDKADPLVVEDYLDCFEDFSTVLLKFIVNLVDNNGNTAMHYAVSHGNFDVVSILLDSKVCNVNQMNNAGYTCVMLVSLAKLKNSAHRTVVQRLFQMADVNIRAKKHCQTALMLAVSHGNLDMVEMLLAAGADINIQDEDGSTALMCAAEHGRVDIVKNLLSQSECDSLVQDVDGSTAFKIAWQAGHRDIGLLLYVHEQMMRSKMPGKLEQRTSSLSPRHHKRHPSE